MNQRLLLVSFTLLFPLFGCDRAPQVNQNQGSAQHETGESTTKVLPAPRPLAYESARLIESDPSKPVVASGTVFDVDGTPCPDAIVTAVLNDRENGVWVKPSRYVYTKTDGSGRYEIRTEPTYKTIDFWATTQGKLGFAYTQEEIHLRGGELVLHIRDASFQPVRGASVTPYLSGCDDMNFFIPTNIREALQKATDENGIVQYPSRLGDHHLGFEVNVEGNGIWWSEHFSGLSKCKHRLFVLTDELEVVARCRDRLILDLALSDHEIKQLRPSFAPYRHVDPDTSSPK